MILALDVHYWNDDSATAAGILFRDWDSDKIESTIVKRIRKVAVYEPGSFYKRELPCLLNLFNEVEGLVHFIVIDGFVTLGKENKPGLGLHLYQKLEGEIPIIGVAKNRFANTPDETKIYRGESNNPLYVTSVGVSLGDAKFNISNMHGDFRIPTLLKRVDQICRQE